MKRVSQIFILIMLAVALIGGVILAGSNNFGTSRAAVETATSGNFTVYSRTALLAMQEPDKQLAMPVKGVRTKQIADTWGAARSGGRGHSGQDIFAMRGTPVYSATSGYILRVGESNLGGKSVFVLGAGGRRYYYAHLNDFAPDLKAGDFVTTSSLLGYVGTTGNAKNTPPHLHFGVYGAGGAINPLTLLTDRT